MRVYPEQDEPTKANAPAVAAMGPLGMVYYPHEPLGKERDTIAEQLVESAHVPLVLATHGAREVRAWCREGVFTLPEEKAKVFGNEHPFLDEVTEDLIAACRHPDAGDLVICGWRPGVRAYSFPLENGAHGGPGSEETSAFALLPADTPLPERRHQYLRPIHLRHAAMHQLGHTEIRSAKRARRTSDRALRIMTYNVHSCVGMDGKLAPQRIARVISQYDPNIVALQELDVGRQGTEGVDQAHLIAQYLEMDHHFHPSMHIEEERYGDAVMTHLPMRMIKAGSLPGLPKRPTLEPRGALWVCVELAGREIQVLNTHLGLSPRERQHQADALIGSDWLGDPRCREPVILCGDFNAMPSSPTCRRLQTHLADAQAELASHRPRKTFFGRFPTARIDHVFVDRGIEVVGVEVANTALTRVASDHLPLIVEVRLT